MLRNPTTALPPTGMTLADFTSVSMIIPQLRGQDTASVIQELSQALQLGKRVPDLLPFYQAALNQEFLVSSDMEAGMAFPHARLPGLKELAFAVGRSQSPLDWGAKNTCSVRLVFLIAVPATDSTQYLLLNSGLARLAKDSQLVNRLHAARDASQMLETFQQIKLQTSQANDMLKKLRTTNN
jgi:mannitol/fructose-specific phosphotransferase system IIA component (Ntr-type)